MNNEVFDEENDQESERASVDKEKEQEDEEEKFYIYYTLQYREKHKKYQDRTRRVLTELEDKIGVVRISFSLLFPIFSFLK